MTHSAHTPSLHKHKASGRAVVTLDGHDFYLGPWPQGKRRPPEEVRVAYDRLIAEWLANGRRLPRSTLTQDGLTVAELLAAYMKHAEGHYQHPDGWPTSELGNIACALRPVNHLYGQAPRPSTSAPWPCAPSAS
jgi:hypothetical protein